MKVRRGSRGPVFPRFSRTPAPLPIAHVHARTSSSCTRTTISFFRSLVIRIINSRPRGERIGINRRGCGGKNTTFALDVRSGRTGARLAPPPPRPLAPLKSSVTYTSRGFAPDRNRCCGTHAYRFRLCGVRPILVTPPTPPPPPPYSVLLLMVSRVKLHESSGTTPAV